MKAIAALSLSACMMVSGAVSGFAACSKNAKDFAVDYRNADGTTTSVAVCPVCGKSAEGAGLKAVENVSSNYSYVRVYRGTLDNGMTVMTVADYGDDLCIDTHSISVTMPAENIEGYKVYQINPDGTETEVEAGITTTIISRQANIKATLYNGSALLHLVPDTEA